MQEIILKYLRKHGFECLRPTAALLDMDGTLYDSMGHHADAWARMAREEGMPTPRDEFFMYEGRTGASTINILYRRHHHRDATPEEAKELYAKKSLYFNQMPRVSAMPGVASLLDTLRHAGLKRVLVTGSGQHSLLSRLDEDFPGIFNPQLRVTAHDVTHGKPHPEPYLKAMDMALAKPWQCVAFENAPLGVESASRSGAFTVAVTTGPIPSETMAEAGADIIYSSMQECADRFPALLCQMYKTRISD